MANKVTLEIIPKTTNLASTGTTTSSGSGGLLATGGKLGVLAGVAVAIFKVLKDMLWVFKPVTNLISGIVKTLGVFLQPIAEVMTLVLRPLLIMMKPFVMFLRAMMAPFRQIIAQMSSLASQEAAAGNLSGVMEINTAMIKTVMGPFIVAFSTVVGEMFFDVAGWIGKQFINAIYDALEVVGKILDSIPILGGGYLEGFRKDRDTLITDLDVGIETMKGTLRAGSSTILESMKNESLIKLDELKAKFPTKVYSTIQEPVENVLDNTQASLTNQNTGLPASKKLISNTIISVNNDLTKNFASNGNIPVTFRTGIGELIHATSVFASKSEEYADKIRDAYGDAKRYARKARDIQVGLINIDLD